MTKSTVNEMIAFGTEQEVTLTDAELKALQPRMSRTKLIAHMTDGRAFNWAHGRRIWVQGPVLGRI